MPNSLTNPNTYNRIVRTGSLIALLVGTVRTDTVVNTNEAPVFVAATAVASSAPAYLQNPKTNAHRSSAVTASTTPESQPPRLQEPSGREEIATQLRDGNRTDLVIVSNKAKYGEACEARFSVERAAGAITVSLLVAGTPSALDNPDDIVGMYVHDSDPSHVKGYITTTQSDISEQGITTMADQLLQNTDIACTLFVEAF